MDMLFFYMYILYDDIIVICKIWDVRKFKIILIKFNIDCFKYKNLIILCEN